MIAKEQKILLLLQEVTPQRRIDSKFQTLPFCFCKPVFQNGYMNYVHHFHIS